MAGEGSKKPKVLKRKGREVEEALLFEDKMDEAALEEWERKMGLVQEEASTPPSATQEPTISPETSQEIQLQAKGPEEQAPRDVPLKDEPSWRQSGKLRWLGLAGVRLYLEEKGPAGKSLFLLGATFLLGCAFLTAFVWLGHKPDVIQEVSEAEESHHMVLDLIVPLKQGKAGLLLSLSLELEGTQLDSWEIRKELLELISPMEPAELLGDRGMARLRAIVGQRLSSKWPWVKADGIRFLEYLIL